MKRTRKFGIGAILLAAAGVGGVSLVSLGTASAAPAVTAAATVDDTTDTSTDATTTAANGTADDADHDGPHTANGITETELAGDEAASVEAAVLAAYPDATIERMETDADGAAFEAHVTLADGSAATVKLDASFTVTGTESGGHGHGGDGGRRGGGGPHTANGITETELAGDEAASVEAAVLAAYPDATIERMETDADGAAFEAHVTLADGSDATVELDASFTVTDTITGHG